MLLKHKRYGQVKARGCADGCKQWLKVLKHDSTSPMVSMVSVLVTAVADVADECDVSIVDIPRAFIQADMDDLVHIQVTSEMVEKLWLFEEERVGFGKRRDSTIDSSILGLPCAMNHHFMESRMSEKVRFRVFL